VSRLEPQLRRLSWIVLAICVGVVLLTTTLILSSRLQVLLGLGRTIEAYRVGDRVDVPPDAYGGASYTVILFGRASCGACQSATPVLGRLFAAVLDSEVDVRVVAPKASSEDQLVYVRALGLDEAHFLPAEMRRLRVRVVPTALLVDREGRILEVSEGGDDLEVFGAAVMTRIKGR
jgi:hypothetical protein